MLNSGLFWPDSTLEWKALGVRGRDATDFLNRITTAPFKKLKIGQTAESMILSAQGRVEAYFHVLKKTDTEYFIEMDAGINAEWLTRFHERIAFYTFSEDVEIFTPAFSRHCAWVFGDEVDPASFPQNTTALAHGSERFGRRWTSIWADSKEELSFLKSLPPITFDQIEDWRILSLKPRVDIEITPTLIPLDSNLQSAIDFHKGCYPGQEVIERIYSIGSPAKRLALIRSSPESVEPRSKLYSGQQEAGEITSISPIPHEGKVGLAFIKKTFAIPGNELTTETGMKVQIEKIAAYQ